jgi:hypothetical protein
MFCNFILVYIFLNIISLCKNHNINGILIKLDLKNKESVTQNRMSLHTLGNFED